MKNLLFLGGTSFFGKIAILKLLATKKFKISVLTRGHQKPVEFSDAVTFIKCDRTNKKELAFVLKDKKFDIVIDNIAFDGEDVKNLLENLHAPLEHYLLCSSAVVYPEWHTLHHWQEREAVLDFVPGQNSYANGKRAAEKQLLAYTHIPYSIYRPTIVQGPEDNSDRIKYFVENICQQKKFAIPDQVILQHVFSADVAEAILQLVQLGPTNMAYNICGDDEMSLEQYSYDIANLLNKPPCFEVISRDKFLRMNDRNFPALFDCSILLSNKLLKTKTKFKPTAIKNWLPITIQWHKEKYC